MESILKRDVWVVLFAAFFLALSSPVESQRVRRNIDSLSAQEMQVLQAAMAAIKALPDSNPNSYGYLRDTHDSNNGPCEHGSEVFLPWHRQLLLRFEEALRLSGVAGAENITLPYWDWSQFPTGQRYPATCEDPSSEFYHPGRVAPGGPPLPLTSLAAARSETTWPRFGGDPLSQGGGFGHLERPAHNYMHSSYVGGDMAFDFTAGRDPMFWLFHTGIDYFWWEWQQRNPGEDPVDPTYLLRGFGDTTVGDVLTAESLGYTYALQAKRTLLDQGLGTAQHTMAAAAEPAESRAIRTHHFDFTVPEPGFQRAELLISNAKLAGASSYTVHYYVHPTSAEYSADDEEFLEKYYAATDANFGGPPEAKHVHGHHPPVGDLRIDVTNALTQLAENHAGETWRITAVYEGPWDAETGRNRPVLLGRDIAHGAVHLALDED